MAELLTAEYFLGSANFMPTVVQVAWLQLWCFELSRFSLLDFRSARNFDDHLDLDGDTSGQRICADSAARPNAIFESENFSK